MSGLLVLAVVAFVAHGACAESSKAGAQGTPSEAASSRAGAPARAAQASSTAPAPENLSTPNCDPCTLKIAASLPPFSFRFDVKLVNGDERLVERIRVSREDKPGWTQTLDVRDMAPISKGDPFFIATADLNFDGFNDVLLATSRGVANTYADYWRFVPTTGEFSYLGNFPLFRLDAEKRLLSTYERGGMGGMVYTRCQYRFLEGALTLVESEKQEATDKPDVYRKTISRLESGKMRVVKEETVKAPPGR